MQSPPPWFNAEAIATIIAVFLAAGLTYWITRLTRERPTQVVVQEIQRTKLMDIHPSWQDRLEVYFIDPDIDRRIRIESLVQRRFVIFNNGSRNIEEPVSLSLRFEKPLSFILIAAIEPTRVEATEDDVGAFRGIHVQIPYLNSFPSHKHFIMFSLGSDQEFSLWLSGTESHGKGWSARFVPLEVSLRADPKPTRAEVEISLMPVFVVFVLVSLVELLDRCPPYMSHRDFIVAMALSAILSSLVLYKILPQIRKWAWHARLPSEFE